MSYRTYVNDFQVFGNGESYDEWFDFIKSQGVQIDEEGNYKGEIKDFMGALTVIEKIVIRLNREREEKKARLGGSVGKNKIMSLFDFTDRINRVSSQSEDETEGYSLFDELIDITDMTYAFMPYAFYEACKDMLEPDKAYSSPNHFHCFKIKEGCSIIVEAR